MHFWVFCALIYKFLASTEYEVADNDNTLEEIWIHHAGGAKMFSILQLHT